MRSSDRPAEDAKRLVLVAGIVENHAVPCRGEGFFVPVHDRGAVLKGMKHQWDELCVRCAVRTIFFHAIECTSDTLSHFMPFGNIGESAASVDFSLVRTAHPTQVEPCCWGLLPLCALILQPHGVYGGGLAGTCTQPRGGA